MERRDATPWAVLLVLMVVSLMAPGGRHLLPAAWLGTYELAQGVLWLGVLACLLHRAGEVRGPARVGTSRAPVGALTRRSERWS